MLIVHTKKFGQGAVLLLSFAALFWVMMLPLFKDGAGNRLNSLQYADAIFNELSKGSSYFIPSVLEEIAAMRDDAVTCSVRITPPDLAPLAAIELERAGATEVKEQAGTLTFSGALPPVLKAAVTDADYLYKNDGEAVAAIYGVQPLKVTEAWWHLLNPLTKELQKQGRFQDAKIVESVVKRAIEPGNNFYGIEKAAVADNILLICGMLAFYVLYALWYGFAIYHIFDGLGLLGEEKAVENVEESEV